MNPPFSEIAKWVDKALDSHINGDVTELIILTKSDPRTKWFSTLITHCDLLCLYLGYPRFGDATNPAPFGVALWYFGENEKKFREVFQEIGAVLMPVY